MSKSNESVGMMTYYLKMIRFHRMMLRHGLYHRHIFPMVVIKKLKEELVIFRRKEEIRNWVRVVVRSRVIVLS